MFDNVSNLLEHDGYDDVHADEVEGAWGSLGGGGEYSTGEIDTELEAFGALA